MRLWVEAILIGAAFVIAGLALLGLLPVASSVWIVVPFLFGLTWLYGLVMGWRLVALRARRNGAEFPVPDRRGVLLLQLFFFSGVLFSVRMDMAEGWVADALLGGVVGAVACLVAMAAAFTLGWTRPRRDGEWL